MAEGADILKTGQQIIVLTRFRAGCDILIWLKLMMFPLFGMNWLKFLAMKASCLLHM